MNLENIFSPVFKSLRAIPFERSTHGLLGGICAGIAERFGFNVWITRIVVLISTLLPVIGAPLYIAAWILLPNTLGRIILEDWLRELRQKN